MRRSQVALAGGLAAALLGAWLLARDGRTPETGVQEARQAEDASRATFLRGFARRPGPATAPPAPVTPEQPPPSPESPPDPFRLPASRELPHRDDPALPPAREALEVEVVDREGRPVPRARMWTMWGEWRTREVVADEYGRATLHVVPGSRVLEVVGQDEPSTGRWCFVQRHLVPAGARSTRVVLCALRPIVGRVVFPDGFRPHGKLVAHREARADPDDEDGPLLAPRASRAGVTEVPPDGRFSIDVPDDGPVALLYESYETSREGRPFQAAATGVAPGAEGVRLTAPDEEKVVSLRLVVRLPDGRSARDVVVWATPLAVTSRHSRSAVRREGTTDSSGRVSFRGVEPWLHEVVVQNGGADDAPWVTATATRFAGGPETEIRLRPSPARVAGIVVDRDGTPVARGWVFATSGTEIVEGALTDARGRFEIHPAPKGSPVNLYARFPASESTSRGYVEDVVAGGREVTIVLEEVGPLWAEGSSAIR